MKKFLFLLFVLQNSIQWSHGFKTFSMAMPSVRPYRVSRFEEFVISNPDLSKNKRKTSRSIWIFQTDVIGILERGNGELLICFFNFVSTYTYYNNLLNLYSFTARTLLVHTRES